MKHCDKYKNEMSLVSNETRLMFVYSTSHFIVDAKLTSYLLKVDDRTCVKLSATSLLTLG